MAKWPARSPDFSVCDYFDWGYLKSKVYEKKLVNHAQLESKIINEINSMS